jgi:hypothetical protein
VIGDFCFHCWCGAQRLMASAVKPSIPSSSKLNKRSQLFIRTHNETLSVVAVCVGNPDRSPFTIYG